MPNLKVLIRVANHTERLLEDVQEIFIFDPIRITDIPTNSTPPHTPSELELSDTEQTTRAEPPSEARESIVTNPFVTSYPAPRLGQEFTRETYLSSASSNFEDPQHYWTSEIGTHNRQLPPVTPVTQRIQEQHTPPPPPIKQEIKREGTPIPLLGSPIQLDTPTPGPFQSHLRRIRRRLSSSIHKSNRQPGKSNHPQN